MKTIRILLSSPGDVADERERARQVIASLARFYQARCQLQPVLWEDLPLAAQDSFQEGIDRKLLAAESPDIAVFVLWSRMGTPLRDDAFRKKDGKPYRSGTEREFHLLLDLRADSPDGRPIILAYRREDQAGFSEMLSNALNSSAPGQQGNARAEELLAQRKLVEQFIEENFVDDHGRNLRAYHTYDKPAAFASRLKVHLRSLLSEMLLQTPAGAILWEGSPYQGLRTFEVSHAPIFFGREQEISELEMLMCRRAASGKPFTVIVAPSGFGKSSLALAGVASSLVADNFDGDTAQWRLAVFQPGEKDGDLLSAFLDTLATPGALDLLHEAGAPSLARLQEAAARDPAGAIPMKVEDTLDQMAARVRGHVRMLIVVDQCEVLWTDGRITPAARALFLQTLHALLASGRVWVLATLRADVYPLTMEDADFRSLKQPTAGAGDCDGVYELAPTEPAAIHRLIREPAHIAGLRFEQDPNSSRTLDEMLLDDAVGHADALPLLEYALEQLFERRTPDGLLTIESYRKIGGVEGALGIRAAETYDKLPAEAQAALQEILPLLLSVQISGDRMAVRKRAAMSALTSTPSRRLLTEALISARFLTTSEQHGVGYAMLAHEALLRQWDLLKTWLLENREILEFREHVSLAAADWQHERDAATGEDRDLLLLSPLALLRGEKTLEAGLLSPREAEFVKLSREATQDSVLRRRRRLRALFTLAAVVIAALSWLSWSTLRQSTEVRRQSAEVQRLLAESDSDRAERLFAEGDPTGAIWYLARAVASGTSSSRAEARLWSAVEQRSWPDLQFEPRSVSQPVVVAAFDPSGKHFAVAMQDGQVAVCSSQTGDLIATLAHPRKVLGARFSPDGTRLLTGCVDSVARLWDMRDPAHALLASCDHESVIAGIAWSADGSAFTTGSWDHKLKVWSTAHPAEPIFTASMKDKVHTVAFHPRDSRLVLGVAKDEASIFDSSTGRVTFSVSSVGDLVGACFSPDGTKLLSFSDSGELLVSDVSAGHREWARHDLATPCQYAEFAPDGRAFLAAAGNRLSVFSVEQPPVEKWSHDFPDVVLSARFTPDGRRIVVACAAGAIEVFSAAQELRLHEPITGRGVPVALDFHPAGNRILSAWSSREFRLHALSAPAPLPRAAWLLGAPPVAAAAIGDAVACIAQNGRGLFINSADQDGAKSYPVQCDLTVSAAAFHPVRGIFVIGDSDGRLLLKDPRDSQPPVEVAKFTTAVTRIAFSADGESLAAGSEDGEIRHWHWPTMSPDTQPIPRHGDKVSALVFLEPGKRLLSAGWDETIFYPSSPAAPTSVHTDGQPLFAAAGDDRKSTVIGVGKGGVFFADGKSLGTEAAFRVPQQPFSGAVSSTAGIVAVGTIAGGVTLWSPRDKRKVAEFSVGRDVVNSLAFDQRGLRLATGAEDGQARVWDVASAQPLTDSIAHARAVRSVLLSATGRTLITIQYDGVVLMWPVPSPGRDMVEMARRIQANDRQQTHRFIPDPSLLPDSAPADLPAIIERFRATGHPTLIEEAATLETYLPKSRDRDH